MTTSLVIRSMLFASLVLAAPPVTAWDSTRLSEPVTVNGHPVLYPVFAVFVMPKSNIALNFGSANAGTVVRFLGKEYNGNPAGLSAPASPGLEMIEYRNAVSGDSGIINVFTMVPAGNVDRADRLNGYRIGKYPAKPRNGLDIYLPPQGFVEVTEANAGTKISPNFTLGQFVAKQESGYPKYVVLRSSLLLKLENILRTLNDEGHPTGGFVIMSGYRTPFYNRAIGNVQYSRHVWGGAADIYIDEAPADGKMDDLNGDGRIDRNDARWFADFINEMSRRGDFGPRIGGLGVYDSTSAHGPFVHVDVRGTRARW